MDSSTAALSETDTDLFDAIAGGIRASRLSTPLKAAVLHHAIGVLTSLGGKSPGFRPLGGNYPVEGSFSPYAGPVYPEGIDESTKVMHIFRMESVDKGGFKKGRRAPHKYVRKHYPLADVRWITHDHYLVTQEGMLLKDSQTLYFVHHGHHDSRICTVVEISVMDDTAIAVFLELPYHGDYGVLSSVLKNIRISISSSIGETRKRLDSLEAMRSTIDEVWNRSGWPRH